MLSENQAPELLYNFWHGSPNKRQTKGKQSLLEGGTGGEEGSGPPSDMEDNVRARVLVNRKNINWWQIN